MAMTAPRRNALDLQFQQFGLYYVLGKGQQTAHGQFWICECQGPRHEQRVHVQIHEAALIEGRATGCGCEYRNQLGKRCPSFRDLTGQQFGQYLVLKQQNTTYLLCHCSCGTGNSIQKASLLSGRSMQCRKCRQISQLRVTIGRWYGSWFVLKRVDSMHGLTRYWCRCRICNVEKPVYGFTLRNGMSTSCRCGAGGRTEPMLHRYFGRWYVLALADVQGRKFGKYYRCQCICPAQTIRDVASADLLRGSSQSCGCLSKELKREHTRRKNVLRYPAEEMIHRTFGRWTVLGISEPNKKGEKRYLCQCSCPERTIKTVLGYSLRTGKSQSCGCLMREMSRKTTIARHAARYGQKDVMRQHAIAAEAG